MTKRGVQHTLEDYVELYARLELEPEDFEDGEMFKDKLRNQLWYEPSDEQFGAMSTLREVGVERLAKEGIKPVYIPTIAFGPSIRYYIQGLRGGFGWARAREIWSSRSGYPW